MNKKSAQTLEFDKVLSYLSDYAISELGRERCFNAVIFDDVNTIKKELLITTQAKNIVNDAINVPLENIFDIEKSLNDARKKLRLNEEEIVNIAKTLRTSRLMRNFLDSISKDYLEYAKQLQEKFGYNVIDTNITEVANFLANKTKTNEKNIAGKASKIRVKENYLNEYVYHILDDMAIFKDNKLYKLIEFDGRQHFFGPDAKWSHSDSLETIKFRDNLKNEYCVKNNISLLRIPYTEIGNITIEMLLE